MMFGRWLFGPEQEDKDLETMLNGDTCFRRDEFLYLILERVKLGMAFFPAQEFVLAAALKLSIVGLD